MPLYAENYSLIRKGFKNPPYPTPTFSRAGVAGKGVEGNGKGVVVLWVKGRMGGGVSITNPHPSFGTQNLGDGLECFHCPTECTSAPSHDYLLDLQKQEIIAVNERSTISVLWKFMVL